MRPRQVRYQAALRPTELILHHFRSSPARRSGTVCRWRIAELAPERERRVDRLCRPFDDSAEPKCKLPAGFKNSRVLFNLGCAPDEGSSDTIGASVVHRTNCALPLPIDRRARPVERPFRLPRRRPCRRSSGNAGRVEDGREHWRQQRRPFPIPLIKPDVPISGIRLSDWLHRRLTNARPSAPGVAPPPWNRTPVPQGTGGALRRHLVTPPQKVPHFVIDMLVNRR